MSKSGWTTFRVYLFVLSIIAIIFLLPIKIAKSHDHSRPELDQWCPTSKATWPPSATSPQD